MSAGDFDLAVAPDGKAYYYFERVHSETICADRWLPELIDLRYDDYKKVFELMFHPDEKEREKLKTMDLGQMRDANRNTSIADYVWLPLKFEGDMVYIDWCDEWRIEDYE